ncbi:hypothetical protein K438DRAFT_1988832 [Mycena galopus ATCC 62051]|nr:hypothetical protein K438DRAFT_1988832 [Mycena galopus ATCC 62051]
MTLLQYPPHRPTIVTNALFSGAAIFAFAPLLLTSKVYLLQYLLLVARLLFSFTAPLVAQERLLLRIYFVAHVTIGEFHQGLANVPCPHASSEKDVCAGVLAISSGPAGPLSASPSPSFIFIALILSVGTAVVSFYLLLMVSTPAEEDLKFPLPSLWPRMRLAPTQWVTLFARLSIVVFFLAVPVAFTLGPIFMPSHTPSLFDYLLCALHLILLFASSVLNSESTDFWDPSPTLRNTVILQCVLNVLGLLAAMIGKDKLLDPDNFNFGPDVFLVSLVGTLGGLFAIVLMCYAGDEAVKLRQQFQPSPQPYLGGGHPDSGGGEVFLAFSHRRLNPNPAPPSRHLRPTPLTSGHPASTTFEPCFPHSIHPATLDEAAQWATPDESRSPSRFAPPARFLRDLLRGPFPGSRAFRSLLPFVTSCSEVATVITLIGSDALTDTTAVAL